MTPTAEQQAIIEAALSTKDSLLINALAGAAKTTTLKMIAERMAETPILLVVFNKKVKEEAAAKLPGHVRVSTMNALGHGIWSTATGKRLIIDTKKSYNLLSEAVQSIDRRSRYAVPFAETLTAVRLAKQTGYIPPGKFENIPRIISQDDFYGSLEDEPSATQIDLINSILLRSISLSYTGAIDFDDQIYMPALFGGSFPKFPLVLVDEAQDLSPLNHTMLAKLVTDRLIAVGDPFQSIYAFRGADTASMAKLKARFNMTELGLSVSFRCPKAVVRNAWGRVPFMKWRDEAEDGKVVRHESWSADTIPDNAAILCRNNAPLFSCALQLLKMGRGVRLVGTDLGPAILRLLKKLGEPDDPQSKILLSIDRWEAEKLETSKAKASTQDKADCLRVFARFGRTLSEAVAYAEHLFKSQGTIQLLSGHKAKGLEWDTVYHLDPFRIPSKWAETEEDKEQELNIKYVIETRAKRELNLVTLEGLRP